MFFLIHLLAGVLTGLALTLVFRDRLVIIMAAVGSVLPDLIDKPLGHIFLANTLNYGRIYGHTLIFISALLLAGLFLSFRYHRIGPLILALVTGILSHQFLDFMWAQPANWYWPVFGPFQGDVPAGFLVNAFLAELTSPYEWVSGIFALFLLVQAGVILLPGLLAYRKYAAIAGIIFATASFITVIFLQSSPQPPASLPGTLITTLLIILGAAALWWKWPEPLPHTTE